MSVLEIPKEVLWLFDEVAFNEQGISFDQVVTSEPDRAYRMIHGYLTSLIRGSAEGLITHHQNGSNNEPRNPIEFAGLMAEHSLPSLDIYMADPIDILVFDTQDDGTPLDQQPKPRLIKLVPSSLVC